MPRLEDYPYTPQSGRLAGRTFDSPAEYMAALRSIRRNEEKQGTAPRTSSSTSGGRGARERESIHIGAPPSRPNKGATDQYSDADQANLHDTVMLAAMLLAELAEEAVRPTREELDAILTPAERIVMRHAKAKLPANPDVRDAMLIGYGMAKYGLRVARAGHPPRLRVVAPHAPQAGATGGGPQQPRGTPQTTPAGATGDAQSAANGLSLGAQLSELQRRVRVPDGIGNTGNGGTTDGNAAQSGA